MKLCRYVVKTILYLAEDLQIEKVVVGAKMASSCQLSNNSRFRLR